MLVEQEAWKREAGFDRIEITVGMNGKGFRTGLDSEPLYTKLYNPRWSHNPTECTLEMNVDVERLRMETSFLQPAPSPTGLEEPGAPHAESQSTKKEETFPLQASLDDFLHICTSPEQEWTTTILLKKTSG